MTAPPEQRENTRELLTCETCGATFRRHGRYTTTPRACSSECRKKLKVSDTARANAAAASAEYARRGNDRYPSKAERDERAARALTMRNAGATWDRIAEQLGISDQQCRNDVGRAIREWVRVPAEQLVDRQRAILLDIVRVEYPAAMDPTSPRHYRAQGKILEALAAERKLFGLDAPQKVSLGISQEEFVRQASDLLKVTGTRPLAELAGIPIDAEVVDEPEDEVPWSNL